MSMKRLLRSSWTLVVAISAETEMPCFETEMRIARRNRVNAEKNQTVHNDVKHFLDSACGLKHGEHACV
jgi:hypothetical protein